MVEAGANQTAGSIGESIGGTIILTDVVENYPGFKKLTGMELAKAVEEHAMEYGISVENDKVVDIKKTKNGLFEAETTSGRKFIGKTVILLESLPMLSI